MVDRLPRDLKLRGVGKNLFFCFFDHELKFFLSDFDESWSEPSYDIELRCDKAICLQQMLMRSSLAKKINVNELCWAKMVIIY